MAYNPGVQNRSAEFLARGIGGAFKSVTDAMELRRERTDEINKTDGELKAFGQTLQGLVKLGTIPQSAVDDYNNVLGSDVKTKQGYLNQSVKSLNLIFEADRNARDKAQSDSAIAVNKAQLDQINRDNANREALTKSIAEIPTSVAGTDRAYVQDAPSGNPNDFRYGTQPPPVSKAKGMVSVVPPFEFGDLVSANTETKTFDYLDDIAAKKLKTQQDSINKTTNEIAAIENLIKNGREVSIDMSGGFGTGSAPIPLTTSERAKVIPELTNAKARLASQEADLKSIETRIAAAEKFAGTPLLKKGDENRVTLKAERIEHWLAHGAQPTDRVIGFIKEAGIKLPESILKKLNTKIKAQTTKPSKKELKEQASK